MTVHLAVAANAHGASYTGLSVAASNVRVPIGMPAFIRHDELFFWEQEWQEGERESARERADGGLVTFDSATDLMKWLMTED